MKAFSSPLAIARVALAVTLATPLVAPLAGAQTDPAQQARLEARFDELAELGFTGFAAIAHEGEIIFARGAGLADPATNRPFTLDTQVDTGSITKSFTGMAIARLIDEGRLSADATLADFFPDVPGDKAGITVLQMLTHTAGLPGAVGDDFSDEGWDSVRDKAFAAELLHAPGSAYRYSNVGYTFLAAIIESVTGRSYEDYLVNEILVPAGIEHTGYLSVYDDAIAARNRQGEAVIDASWGGHAPNWNLMGNGGLVSTPRDILAWEAAYEGGTMVSPRARDLAFTPYIREHEGQMSFYGFGLSVEYDPVLGRIYWHNGGNPSFNSHWRVLAEQGYALFTTTNQRGLSADTAMEALVAALVDRDYQLWPPLEISDDPVSLPDTVGGQVAAAFFTMIGSDDEAVWRDYVLNGMSDQMRALASMEGHLGMMDQLRAEFAGGQIVATYEIENAIRLGLRYPDDDEVMPVVLEFTSDGLLNGLQVG